MIFKRNAKGFLERETAGSRQDFVEPAVVNAPSSEALKENLPKVEGFEKAEHYQKPNVPLSTYARGNLANSQSSTASALEDHTPKLDVATIEQPEAVLSEGLSFKGELSFQHYICINGNFEGVLYSHGKLKVGKTGWVKSDLKLRSAIIEGRVDGNIQVEDLLELRGSARICGNITARYLRVDDGVTLIGHVRIHPEGIFEDQPSTASEEG